MNSDLHTQIYNNMDLRETEDLMDIWMTNDRAEWSDEAFDVVRDILRTRGVEPPEQDEAVYEHKNDESDESAESAESEDESYDLTETELRIVDDESPPEFYDPFQVLKFARWMEIAALASIGLAVVVNLIQIPKLQNMLRPYFVGDASLRFLPLVIAIATALVAMALQVAITYFPLKALAHILRILMEMEFNSRKPSSSATEH